MRLEASHLVDAACTELGIRLAELIAMTGVWASPSIYQLLEHVGGIWYPDRRRANTGLRVDGRPVEAVGQVLDGVTLDNNTYANNAFKVAIGVDRQEFVGFHICHVWPGTAYDADCYTNIANLVAIPAELSSLTDHHPQIVACLKYRSWELYGWKPAQAVVPTKPPDYPARWRDAWPNSEAARRAAMRRVRGEAQLSVGGRVNPIPHAYLSAHQATAAGIIAAFYLSKFDHERLNLGNQTETLDRIATHLGINRNTLRQQRDYFDSHTGSHRQGWKTALPPQLDAAFQALTPLDEPRLRQQVLASIGISS